MPRWKTDGAGTAVRAVVLICLLAGGSIVSLWACGRPTVTLPPIGSASDTKSVPVAAGMPNASEPGMPVLVASFIRGHSAAAYVNGSRVACFSDLGPPCAGVVVDQSGQTRTVDSTDVCAYSNPTGKAHLVVADAQFKVYFDVSFSLPTSFSSIPTEIGDENARLVFDEACSL